MVCTRIEEHCSGSRDGVVQPDQGGIAAYFECDRHLRLYLLHWLWTQPTKLKQRERPILQRSIPTVNASKNSVILPNFSKRNSFGNRQLRSRKSGSRKTRRYLTRRSRNLKATQQRIGAYAMVKFAVADITREHSECGERWNRWSMSCEQRPTSA